MIKSHGVYWLGGGLILGYLLWSKKNIQVVTVKLGDKGKDVAELQTNLNKFLRTDHFQDPGTYDRETMKITSELFEGTSGLVDARQGEVDKKFLKDFNTIFNRL